MFDMISQGNNDKLQVLKDQMTKGDQQIDETKGHALGNILMAFGANWAANASKPGATFVGSAAASAPAAQQEMATQDKILRDMNDVQNKIKMDYTKFQISLEKDDQKTALTAVQDMRRNALLASQIEQQAAASRGSLALDGVKLRMMADDALATANYRLKELGIKGSQVASQNRRMDIEDKKLGILDTQSRTRLAGVVASAADKFDKNNSGLKREYEKKIGPVQADQQYRLDRQAYINETIGPYLSGGAGISSTSRYPTADSLE
jgi:hypothetical protein